MPARIMPFYLVCDQSYSMTDHLDALNDGLGRLHAAVGADPVIAEATRFCLIGFAGTAEVLRPLGRPGDGMGPVGLTTQAATSFGAAFTLLREIIELDVGDLRARACEVYRPAVFFLSDGHPTDPGTWPAAYQRLVDPDWPARPNIVAFGIGDADATTIGRIGTLQAFMSHGGVSPADALRGFAGALAGSVAGAGDLASRVPARVPGFGSVRIDAL